MKTLPLTKGQVATVDDCDFEELNKNKWTATRSSHGKTWYAYRRIKKDGRWTHIRLHRQIMGDPKGIKIDHKDGNGLNNSRENLRECTHAQNLMNMRMHNKHGLKGIAFIARRSSRKWMAKIRAEGRPMTLGYFESATEAALAYNEAAKRYFGSFAKLNPI